MAPWEKARTLQQSQHTARTLKRPNLRVQASENKNTTRLSAQTRKIGWIGRLVNKKRTFKFCSPPAAMTRPSPLPQPFSQRLFECRHQVRQQLLPEYHDFRSVAHHPDRSICFQSPLLLFFSTRSWPCVLVPGSSLFSSMSTAGCFRAVPAKLRLEFSPSHQSSPLVLVHLESQVSHLSSLFVETLSEHLHNAVTSLLVRQEVEGAREIFACTVGGKRKPKTTFASLRSRAVLYDRDSVRVPPVVLATTSHAPPVALPSLKPTRCCLLSGIDDSDGTRTTA